MEKLIRYDSIDELKADSTPAILDDARSAQRHERFMGFLDFLKDAEPATKEPAVNPDAVNGLQP